MMTLIDTHCHLDFESFEDDRQLVIERARDAGVERIIVPALDLANCEDVLNLAHTYDEIFVAVGVHPNSSTDWDDRWVGELTTLAQDPKVVAIGEIGLDYYRDWSPRTMQQKAFAAQLSLAAELDLPVIVHNREADDDVLLFLSHAADSSRPARGVLHSFSGDWMTAERALDMGLYIGFTGPITFKNADDLRAVARRIPLSRVLIETDSPFLAPQPRRGQRNEPAYVRFVAEQLAEIYGITANEVASLTTANAQALFARLRL